jgi:hypothetical protein
MKTLITGLLLSCLLSNCTTDSKKEGQIATETGSASKIKADAVEIQPQSGPDTLKGSLNAIAHGKIGNMNISISYHSPAVRGRIVWGGLVPYDKVWVTGAHMATAISFDQDLLVGSTPLPAGQYALFTIPGKETWTIIINKNWQQHLTDNYDPKEDVVRVQVKPETGEPHQERLRYAVEGEGESAGEIVMYWEKTEISLPVSLKPQRQ